MVSSRERSWPSLRLSGRDLSRRFPVRPRSKAGAAEKAVRAGPDDREPSSGRAGSPRRATRPSSHLRSSLRPLASDIILAPINKSACSFAEGEAGSGAGVGSGNRRGSRFKVPATCRVARPPLAPKFRAGTLAAPDSNVRSARSLTLRKERVRSLLCLGEDGVRSGAQEAVGEDGWHRVGPPMARNPALSGEDQWGDTGTGPVRADGRLPEKDIIRALS